MDEDSDDLHRLTPEELAFLLRDPAEQARRAERNARGNRTRTERRHSDPAYAERLRTADRERQRRRRAREAIGRPDRPEPPPVPLPTLTQAEALRRLEAHVKTAATPQAAQVRNRPDLLRRYVAGFVVYRALAQQTGVRPTRGAIAAALRSRFALSLTSAQVQKLRDHVEAFASPGGPWHAESLD